MALLPPLIVTFIYPLLVCVKESLHMRAFKNAPPAFNARVHVNVIELLRKFSSSSEVIMSKWISGKNQTLVHGLY